MFERTHERGNRLCILPSLYGLPGQRYYLESTRLQQPKYATTAKHLVNWDWSVFKCSDTNVVFQTAIFLILVVRNNKTSSGIDGKPTTAFPEIVYITVILSYVSVSTCSLNRLNM